MAMKKKAVSAKHPYQIGESYFIRTVTNYYTGRLIKVFQKEIVLENAAWIADTGRFHNAMKTGQFNEIEPFIGEVIVSRGAIVDVTVFRFALPDNQK